jgi:6-phosphogluconolactonase
MSRKKMRSLVSFGAVECALAWERAHVVRRRRHIVAQILWLALAALLLPTILGGQNNSSLKCYYDELGQLTTVVYPSGDVVQYTYDAIGNILSISKSTLSSPGALAIFNVTPLRGAPGDQVTIQGQGFSATLANDTLQFNGAAATVTSATTSTIVASVPSAATTGPITVLVGGVTAQGPSFSVFVPLAINPVNPSIGAGLQQQFRSTNIRTNQDVTASVTWSSSNTAVATISNSPPTNGLANSLAVGTATITASLDSLTTSTTLTVTPATLSFLEVTPGGAGTTPGGTIQFTATGIFTDGTRQDLTNSADWSSSNTAVATISNSTGSKGLATAIAIGTTTITAASGTASGSANLAVTLAGVPRFAFVTAENVLTTANSAVYTYAIDAATGDLRPLRSAVTGQIPFDTVVHPSGKFVYVMNKTSPTSVSAYTLNQTDGTLTPISGSPFSAQSGNDLSGLAVDPLGKFLYVVGQPNQGGNEIWEYTIDATTGALAFVGTVSPVGLGDNGIAMHPSGKFLYGLGFGLNGRLLFVFSIDPATGLLTQIPGSPFDAISGTTPNFVTVEPAGKFLYAAGGDLVAYSIDSTSGALTPIGAPSSTGLNVTSATVDPSGKFVYLPAPNTKNLFAYAINPTTGTLTAVPGSPFPVPNTSPANSGRPYTVSVDPGSKFLYLADPNFSLIGLYSINSANGALTLTKVIESPNLPSSIATSSGAAPVAFTPTFSYTANAGSKNISGYTIDPASGALTQLPGSPFAAGTQPSSVAVHPTGKFAYAVNTSDQTITAYAVDTNTGLLTQIGAPIAEGQVGAGAAMIDQAGRFLYVVNTNQPNSQGSVSAYQINPSIGSLAPITGSPFAAGTNPVALAVDFVGAFVLVANSNSNDVTLFQIDQVDPADPTRNGSLKPLTLNGVIWATGTTPSSITVGSFANPPSNTPAGGPGPLVFVANSGSGDITSFILTGTSLQQGGTTFVGSNLQALTLDRSGKYLYVAGGNSTAPGSLWAFSINPTTTTGGLTALAGSPFPVGINPTSVTVDISGQFVYVSNSGSNNVSAFKIDPATGSLAAVGSPFPAGATPKSITTTGTIQ